MFGSPSFSNVMMQEGLIDSYRLFVNPVLLGDGIPLFRDNRKKQQLELTENVKLASGVVALHYEVIRP